MNEVEREGQEPLTWERVHEQVEQVLEMDRHGDDPEAAHLAEDRLYVEVLRAVAADVPNVREMAVEALRADESGGERWYA
jgi:hypothetical protein